MQVKDNVFRRMSNSEIILSLTNKVQRLMHADHAMIIFTPMTECREGVFFNFETN
jgi:hypothetical protein